MFAKTFDKKSHVRCRVSGKVVGYNSADGAIGAFDDLLSPEICVALERVDERIDTASLRSAQLQTVRPHNQCLLSLCR